MPRAFRVLWMVGLALLSTALVGSVCSHGKGGRLSGGSICDKFGISSVGQAMGEKDVIVVVQPTIGAHNASSSSGTHLRQVNARVDRYLYGSGPAEITVSQADMCGSSGCSD